jgi:hypothetical protein
MTDERKRMASAARRRDTRAEIQRAWREDCGVECGFNAALEREARWVREDTRQLISLEQESEIYSRAYGEALADPADIVRRLKDRIRELEETVSQ